MIGALLHSLLFQILPMILLKYYLIKTVSDTSFAKMNIDKSTASSSKHEPLVQCWPAVYDVGPTSVWVEVKHRKTDVYILYRMRNLTGSQCNDIWHCLLILIMSKGKSNILLCKAKKAVSVVLSTCKVIFPLTVRRICWHCVIKIKCYP